MESPLLSRSQSLPPAALLSETAALLHSISIRRRIVFTHFCSTATTWRMKHFDVFTNSWYTTHVGGFDISATTEEGCAEQT
jgi:hypothetical protein